MRRIHHSFTAKYAVNKNMFPVNTIYALRDIQDLIDKEMLQKNPAGGRSTNYELKPVE